MTSFSPLLNALDLLRADAAGRGHRRLLVFAGEPHWSRAVVEQWLGRWQPAAAAWFGETAPAGLEQLSLSTAASLLGRDLELVVIDAWQGLDPDALAIAAGTVVAGGMLVLCTPTLADWPGFPDPDYRRLLVQGFSRDDIKGRFLRHLVREITADGDARVIVAGNPVPAVVIAGESVVEPMSDPVGPTAEQQAAVAAILQVADGHSRRPLVITADRGRGKSSALGMACAQLMRARPRTVIVTAPTRSAVAQVFAHARSGLPAAAETTDRLVVGDSQLRFLPPDELLRARPAADLLLVDEAAAIPAPLLERLVSCYNRSVFSTTVHGYEGTGRGFDIRFRPRLRALSNQVREMHLQQPVRWAAGDPLEAWLYRALLLDADRAVADLDATESVAGITVSLVDRDLLVADRALLRQVFGLLVLAHYQTSPADLRNLLDGPNVSVWLVCRGDRVLAAALIAEEGGFDPQLAEAVWRGDRRPRGHLLPQSLAAHAGFQQAPLLRYWRVMRIAVHPSLWRCGLGGRLLQSITARARQQGIDIVGSSFAATADVIAFWRSQQLLPVRMGYRRDASSGCHSVMMVSALNNGARGLLAASGDHFGEQFPRLLETAFARVEADTVIALLSGLPVFDGYRLRQQDWLDVAAFAEHRRQFEDCALALGKLLLLALQHKLLQVGNPGHRLAVQAILQRQSIDCLREVAAVSGRSALQQSLRGIINTIYQSLLQRRSR